MIAPAEIRRRAYMAAVARVDTAAREFGEALREQLIAGAELAHAIGTDEAWSVLDAAAIRRRHYRLAPHFLASSTERTHPPAPSSYFLAFVAPDFPDPTPFHLQEARLTEITHAPPDEEAQL